MASGVASLILYSKPSCSVSRTEADEVLSLAEKLKSFARAKAENWLRAQNHRPILNSYGSDGTPARVMSYYDIILSSGKVFRTAL